MKRKEKKRKSILEMKAKLEEQSGKWTPWKAQ